jgi:hypothetical protein
MFGLRRRKTGQHAATKDVSRRTVLHVEQCEDRCVPANLALVVTTLQDVNNPNDDAVNLTLREAIAKCNDEVPTTQHTITFAWPIYGGTITLNPDPNGYGQLALRRNIDINGAVEMIVQRDQTSEIKHRLFYVGAGVTARLSNLELRRGAIDGSNGGAIVSFGNLTLSNCSIHHNVVTDGTGGGVQAQAGSLTIKDGCGIDDNQAVHGGGIFLNAGVGATIKESIFEHNIASGYGGGIGISCPEAGDAATVTLWSSHLYRNEAASLGGGIWVEKRNEGPGVLLNLQQLTEIRENKVTDAQGKGGGIYFGRGTISFTGDSDAPVKILYNTATTGDGMYRVTGTTLAPNPNVIYTDDEAVEGA